MSVKLFLGSGMSEWDGRRFRQNCDLCYFSDYGVHEGERNGGLLSGIGDITWGVEGWRFC